MDDANDEEDVDKPALQDHFAAFKRAVSILLMQDLFCFDAPQLTQGMTVTCAEWNSNNKAGRVEHGPDASQTWPSQAAGPSSCVLWGHRASAHQPRHSVLLRVQLGWKLGHKAPSCDFHW